MRIAVNELAARAERLTARLAACDLCPRRCGVDRLAGKRGFCGVGHAVPLAAAVPHFGEEPPLSGAGGAGTVFVGGCNLRCGFCQNHEISRLEIDLPEVTPAELGAALLSLQDRGCENVELVTPTHVVPQILTALARARPRGLNLPVVFNTGGYESIEVLRELEGVVDVYLPDLKYADAETARALSDAADYWDVARAAVTEMVRQAGPLRLDDQGVARSGVLVRHLVLPNDLAASRDVLTFLAELSPRPALSLMAQFYPPDGCDHPLLQRGISRREYEKVAALVDTLGFDTGWVQDRSSESTYRPNFRAAHPFDDHTQG